MLVGNIILQIAFFIGVVYAVGFVISLCNRYFYRYIPRAGIGHFIHTYECDGNPIPSFYGEPEVVILPNAAEELADLVWDNLNEDNKVSLFVRTISLVDSKVSEFIINKNI